MYVFQIYLKCVIVCLKCKYVLLIHKMVWLLNWEPTPMSGDGRWRKDWCIYIHLQKTSWQADNFVTKLNSLFQTSFSKSHKTNSGNFHCTYPTMLLFFYSAAAKLPWAFRSHHNQYSSNSPLPTHVWDGKGGYYQETTILYMYSVYVPKDNRNLVDNGVMSEIHSFFYLLYLLAMLWTGALSDGKLPLNEHICILKIGFCVMSENSFFLYLLHPLVVLWTGALSVGKLLLIEKFCIHKIGFCVMSENLFLSTSFTHLLCCELVHSQEVSCL